jgi:hypothetical protein
MAPSRLSTVPRPGLLKQGGGGQTSRRPRANDVHMGRRRRGTNGACRLVSMPARGRRPGWPHPSRHRQLPQRIRHHSGRRESWHGIVWNHYYGCQAARCGADVRHGTADGPLARHVAARRLAPPVAVSSHSVALWRHVTSRYGGLIVPPGPARPCAIFCWARASLS